MKEQDLEGKATPWKKAMQRILLGLAFSTITLNFGLFNHILPAVGIVFLLLGFRTLRRENKWFWVCWIMAVFRVLCCLPQLILNTMIVQSEFYASFFGKIPAILNMTAIFVQIICLWQGLRAIQQKNGRPAQAKSAGFLLLWYGIMCLCAFAQVQLSFIGFLLVVCYIGILISLYRLVREFDEEGYAIQTASVRIPDWAVVLVLAAVTAVGMACGYVFGGSYAMDWKPVEKMGDAKTEEIKQHLLELGFPEEVLQDLTEEDIKTCEAAIRVAADVNNHFAAGEREIFNRDTNRDVQLRITSVAVELPGEQEEWKIFHHFCYLFNPGFYGTESIQLWPAYRNSQYWEKAGEISGRLLCDREGQTYTADYFYLGEDTSRSEHMLWGEQIFNDIFAGFSLPNDGEKQRGYVSYGIRELNDGCMIDAWINYTHQKSWLQYPALTATAHQKKRNLGDRGAFLTVQDALQFRAEEEIEMIS